MPRTVWILGAGFSRSLGGPLLTHMLTPASQMKVRAAFPKTDPNYSALNSDEAGLVYALYQKFGPDSDIGDRHWNDAEAFLEMLDIAAHGSDQNPSAVVVSNLVKRVRLSEPRPPLATLAAAARRVLAAECSAFLKDADTRAETWEPYKRWARKLVAGDTIISFNYDRVVELARDAGGGLIEVVLDPATQVSADVPLLKLHGSVDWVRTPQGVRKHEREDFALVCSDAEPVIASPGPTKQLIVKEMLESLWQAALTRIENAEVIVFVGYRFPPSDSQARQRLYRALTRNRQADHLNVRVVLGPDTNHEHVLRLKGILEYAMAGAKRQSQALPNSKLYTIRVHPLGAEDFLDLFEEGHLNSPRY